MLTPAPPLLRLGRFRLSPRTNLLVRQICLIVLGVRSPLRMGVDAPAISAKRATWRYWFGGSSRPSLIGCTLFDWRCCPTALVRSGAPTQPKLSATGESAAVGNGWRSSDRGRCSWLAWSCDGATRAQLGVVDDNVGAAALYRTRGFAPTGEREAALLGPDPSRHLPRHCPGSTVAGVAPELPEALRRSHSQTRNPTLRPPAPVDGSDPRGHTDPRPALDKQRGCRFAAPADRASCTPPRSASVFGGCTDSGRADAERR